MSQGFNAKDIFEAGTEWAKQEAANIIAELERIKARKLNKLPTALPVIDPRVWQGKLVPERQWFVEGLIPDRTVTNLSGAGGSGKTEIILQLVAASSLKTQWFGKDVSVGPCLYYGAEDEADELHRRLETIVQRAGRNLSDLDGIRLIPMAGLDAVLAEPDRKGNLAPTLIFPKLESQAKVLRPKLIVIDPSADVFGGDEINRAQVRKFVSMLRTLALDIDCAVLLLSHPSLSGLNSGTGTSGSTAWNNSVRSRLYLEVPNESPDERVLKVVKANYGKTGEAIAIRWNDGVYDLDTGPDPVVDKILNKSADDVFMAVFRKLTGQGQALGPNVGPTYAPKKIASHSDAKGYNKQKLADAMQRLLDGGRLRIEITGPPSRRYTQLVAALN
jgi:RecA-family ATPase